MDADDLSIYRLHTVAVFYLSLIHRDLIRPTNETVKQISPGFEIFKLKIWCCNLHLHKKLGICFSTVYEATLPPEKKELAGKACSGMQRCGDPSVHVSVFHSIMCKHLFLVAPLFSHRLNTVPEQRSVFTTFVCTKTSQSSIQRHKSWRPRIWQFYYYQSAVGSVRNLGAEFFTRVLEEGCRDLQKEIPLFLLRGQKTLHGVFSGQK